MKSLVSIIVPVYNVEKYLERCVESLINQTYDNIEILLINDGSTDESLKICNKYALADSRVRAFDKNNEGLGLTRNFGIEKSQGEYIAFVDSDDFLEENAIEVMLKKVENSDLDVVVCSYFYGNETKQISLPEKTYNRKEIHDILLVRMMGNYGDTEDLFTYTACWRLFRKDTLNKHNIRFQSERKFIWEDLIFSTELYPVCEKVALVNTPVYHYCFNQNSLTHRYRADKFEKIIYLYKYMRKKIVVLNLPDEAMIRLNTNFLGHIRTCIKLECFYSKDNGIKTAMNNIDEICADDTVQELLKTYPSELYNNSQRIYSFFMKHKCVNIVYLLTCAQNHKKKIM